MSDSDDIADKIYEAAVIPELWPDVLDTISKRTESAFGTLYVYREGSQLGKLVAEATNE